MMDDHWTQRTRRWKKLEDVPVLVVEWANTVAGEFISLEEIQDLVITYEDWRDEIDLMESD